MKKQKLSEAAIRKALICSLREGAGKLLEEVRIEGGTARIDVATFGAHISGYEIKSDYDNFDRMSNQIHAYNRVFSRINLVCGPRHVPYAKAVLPSWWGIYRAEFHHSNIRIVEEKAARSHESQDAYSLASLIDKQYAIEFLRMHHFPIRKSASLREVWAGLAGAFSLQEIEQAVIQQLQSPPSYSSSYSLFDTV
jgi:hypothetical protein